MRPLALELIFSSSLRNFGAASVARDHSRWFGFRSEERSNSLSLLSYRPFTYARAFCVKNSVTISTHK